jgi:anti-sigma factor RsiW
MPCAEFEDLLLDYGELDSARLQKTNAHLTVCADCRTFLKALEEVDAALADFFTGYQISPTFQRLVYQRLQGQQRLRRPSFIPEVLDFVGWAAVLAILACFVAQLNPSIEVGSLTVWIAAAAFFVTGLLFGFRAYVDLKR